VLSAHNRRNVASDEARKKITYWVSDGKSGVYSPNGFACVVELDLNGKVRSWANFKSGFDTSTFIP
jgi:hypothetical protein